MKLTSAQIQHVQQQVGVEPIAEEHPVMPQLKDVFGDHTFYLLADGLQILEPVEHPETEGQAAQVVMLAKWANEDRTSLVPQTPEPTDVYISLASNGSDPAA